MGFLPLRVGFLLLPAAFFAAAFFAAVFFAAVFFAAFPFVTFAGCAGFERFACLATLVGAEGRDDLCAFATFFAAFFAAFAGTAGFWALLALAGLLAISLLRTAAELGRPEGTEGQ